jgi:hypothetical protein
MRITGKTVATPINKNDKEVDAAEAWEKES